MDQRVFTNIIKDFPQIWDRSNPFFRENNFKKKAWIAVGEKIGFSAERAKSIREWDKPSQNGHHKWDLFELKCLDPNIVSRKLVTNIESDLQQIKEHQSQISHDIPLLEAAMSQTDLDKSLVNLVRKTTPIWDKNLNTFSNKQLKSQLWDNIAAKLNTDPRTCTLRWKALREKYIRQKNKFQQGDKWELLDDMSFLDNVIQYRRKPDDTNYQNLPLSEPSQITLYPMQRKESTESISSLQSSQKQYFYEEESSLNDSSNDLVMNIKNEENVDEIQNSVPDSSSRKRSVSLTSDELSGKRQKEETRDEKVVKSPEELFGNLVAAMLSKKPEKERNLYMIEIMTVLSK